MSNGQGDNPLRTPRRAGETFKRFMQCLAWAEEGKTFMYVHPKFVAIDMKSWNKLKREKRIPQSVYYDEYADWTPEMSERLEKYLAGAGAATAHPKEANLDKDTK